MRAWRRQIGWLCCGLVLAHATACTRFKVRASAMDDALAAGAGLVAVPVGSPVAGVAFQGFARDGDARHDRPFEGRIQVDLWREVGDHWELVVRTDDPSWSRDDLLPGEYRLEVGAITEDGEVHDPEGRTRARFTLADGERADVRVTLRSTPWEAIVVIAVAAVVVAVVVVATVAQRGELPKPGVLRPPRFRPAPPFLPPLPHPHVVYVPVDVGFVWVPLPAPADAPDRARVTSLVLPGPGHPDGAVLVGFSRAMDGAYVGPDTFSIADAAGRPVATSVYYDRDRRTARITPLRPLPDGDYALTVLAPELRDLDGHPPVDRAFVRRFHVGPDASPVRDAPRGLPGPDVASPDAPPSDAVPADPRLAVPVE